MAAEAKVMETKGSLGINSPFFGPFHMQSTGLLWAEGDADNYSLTLIYCWRLTLQTD